MFERCASEEDLADVHRHLVLAYSLAGSVEEAQEALDQARRLHEPVTDPVRQAKFDNVAGIHAANRQEFQLAQELFASALDQASEHQVDTVAQSASNNLGTLALLRASHEEALGYFETALAASR